MDKSYYNKYYTLERNHWWFKIRSRILMDTIRRKIGKDSLNILNIGSATHYTSELLMEYGKVISLEYDEECCKFARNELGFEVINGSATKLPFKDNSFNLICAFDVIEHIEDDQLAIKEIERVCMTNSGYIILTVPAFSFLWSDHDVVNHHFRRYTMRRLLNLIDEKAKIIKKTYFNFLLFPLISIFRLASNSRLKKTNPGNAKSDFDNINIHSSVNMIFERIFNLERTLLKFLNFPIGVSILLLYKIKK